MPVDLRRISEAVALTLRRTAADTYGIGRARRTFGMGVLPLRLRRRGFSRADWVGDGMVTVLLGLAVVAGVFLPWANYSTGHDVNLSAHSSPGINGALATQWGLPVLALAALVVVVGVAMMVRRPLKLSVLPCLGVSLAGVAITMVCFSAGWHIYDPMRPGLGLYAATLGGILLVPTGLASAMVAYILTSPAIMARVRARTAARAAARAASASVGAQTP
jgi:hypothetical protein